MTTKVLTEGQHKGEFLVSEGNGEISREVGTLTSGQKVADGRLLSFVAGKLVASTGHLASSGASDEVFAGFAYGACDASVTGSNADRSDCVYIARMAEVKASNTVLHAVSGGGAAAATAAVKVAIAKLFLFLR